MADDRRRELILQGLTRVGAHIEQPGESRPRTLGLLSSPLPGMLSFAADAEWYRRLAEAPEIAGVVVLDTLDVGAPSDRLVARHSNPRAAFYWLHAWLAEETDFYEPSMRASGGVAPDAQIDPRAVVEPGAEIGSRTRVAAGAVVTAAARIGRDCVIDHNAVIGGEGFQVYEDREGTRRPCRHVGEVVLGDNVVVKANSCVDRALWGSTVIGEGVQIDHLVYVAHNVRIGKDTTVAAGVSIGGSTTIGGGCWLGLGAAIRDGIEIGDGAFIGMGAVVTGDVDPAGRRLPMASIDREQGARLQRVLGGHW